MFFRGIRRAGGPAAVLLGLFASGLPSVAIAQTPDHPVLVEMRPAAPTVAPGERSAVVVTFRIPRGFILGPNDPTERNPVGTAVAMVPLDHFSFEPAVFPEPGSIGIPVHKGNAPAFSGKISAVVPFTVDRNVPEGDYEIRAFITYTPSLDAGHLRTHPREPYRTTVAVRRGKSAPAVVPSPSSGEVPESFIVVKPVIVLSQPMKTMLYQWNEGTAVARFLHWMWIDPPNHGKHVQTAWVPFLTLTEKMGNGFGMSLELANVTREGIMTGFLQMRGYHNEYNGATAEVKAISCPAAYFNYQFSAEISSGGQNKQVHFHTENLTVGRSDRFGYEFQAGAAHDPRARFNGVGPGTREADETNYTHEETGGFLDLYWMPFNKIRFGVGGRVRDVDVAKGADKLRDVMPFTVEETVPGGRLAEVPGIMGATIVGERVSMVYDSRNSEFAPSDGFYGKVTGGYNHVTDQVVTGPDPVTNYGRFTADLRRYFSTLDQKMTLVLRHALTLTTSDAIPFFDQAEFGGGFSDRGFTSGRFYGRHAVFGSMELRYQVMTVNMLGVPMEVEMAPFLDMGQVFDNDRFGGRFNVNPGMSVRLLNKPNVGIVSNGALGQDGFVLTGGVQLPF